MATKLKNLLVSKVDFVDEGANPDAHIKLFKRNDTGDAGGQGPKETKSGNEKGSGVLKKLFGRIGKAVGMDPDEIEDALEEIQKGDSASFRERFNAIKNRKIEDEIWDICYALQSSLCSILNDEELDAAEALAAMQESMEEFSDVIQDCIKQWSAGNASNIVSKREDMTEAEIEIAKSVRDRLTEAIDKASAVETNITNEGKGEEEMGLRIDKSKLTPAEAAFLESIEKRYGTEEGEGTPSGTDGAVPGGQPSAPAVAKSSLVAPPIAGTGAPAAAEGAGAGAEADIYKGLHPAVRAELEELKKFRESSEERELTEVANRYAIIGKKEEELVPLLKSLKAAGGSAYDDMIAVLDQAVEVVEKSGAFSEIGKSGHGSGGVNGSSSEAKIATIAKGYVEKEPSLSYSEALAKAWEDNPEILAEYDEEAGF
ncbi:MAG: hypothetical protein HFI33_15410 [Lachnospiraceae bacterium]|nr:hypothetical protein [Lachnospiraceae bacterium]